MDFLRALKEKKVEGVVFMPPSGDVAFALIEGKSVRIGEGWPVEVSNSWSSPNWVVRILQNEGVPYKFAYNFEKKPKTYPPAFDKRPGDYKAGVPTTYSPTYPRGLAADTLNPTGSKPPGMFQGAAEVMDLLEAGR